MLFRSGYHGSNGSNGSYNGGNTFRTLGGFQGSYESDERMGPVMMVYSLDADKFNCQKLFNLLCLYGNVKRIKFMKSKQGCAMIEFADCEGVSKACKLTGYELFNSKLTIRPSKSKFVGEPIPFTTITIFCRSAT